MMWMRRAIVRRRTLMCMLAAAGCLALASDGAAEIIWFDGTRSERLPEGRLVTDNEDYWGEAVLTGVTYQYAVEPNSPADDRPDRLGRHGRILVNGNQGRGVREGQNRSVGMAGGEPLVVIFDFNRTCEFTEWNVGTPTRDVAITLELRGAEDEPWETVFEQAGSELGERTLHRLELADRPSGRYARLTVQSADPEDDTTLLNEVLAWGDAEVSDELPEAYQPVVEHELPRGIGFETIPGVSKSAVSDRESFYWRRSLDAEHRDQDAVWAEVPTWSSISDAPILPEAEAVNAPLRITMARNETEAVAVALRNTHVTEPREVRVQLEPVTGADGSRAEGLEASLGVFGVIGDRNFGHNLGPIFEADNLLGASLMRRYLLNGAAIAGYPDVTLSPSGAAVFWLAVTSDDAMPGTYTTQLSIEGGEPVDVEVEVLDVTLPKPFAFVQGYGGSRHTTNMFPYVHADRETRDVDYALTCGLSVWRGRTQADVDRVRDRAAERGIDVMYHMGTLVPTAYRYFRSVDQVTPERAANIADHVADLVARAESLGLDYGDWYGEIIDEPGEGRMEGMAILSKTIKQADPDVNIYLNPAFWVGWANGAVADDATVAPTLTGEGELENWYRRFVDISMPLFLLLDDRPESWEAFAAPRLANTYYYVSTHLARSEQADEVQLYRRMAWDSYTWGFNGWAFYAYYAPRGSAWNHYDRNPRGEGLQEPWDYQMVYPGPRGVIRTRHSEALREGWEDWRLLHLLEEKGLHDELDALTEAYKRGEPPADLRDRALRAAATAN